MRWFPLSRLPWVYTLSAKFAKIKMALLAKQNNMAETAMTHWLRLWSWSHVILTIHFYHSTCLEDSHVYHLFESCDIIDLIWEAKDRFTIAFLKILSFFWLKVQSLARSGHFNENRITVAFSTFYIFRTFLIDLYWHKYRKNKNSWCSLTC